MNTKLIEFSFGNYRSFKETVTLSMVAAKLNSQDDQIDKGNTIHLKGNPTLLTSTAIYGANASGKSNVIDAITFMRSFVVNSSRDAQIDEPINVSHFRLSVENNKKPSFFEVVFLLDNIKYRYGFEVNRKKVISEWLFFVPRTKEVQLFIRDQKGIKVSRNFTEGQKMQEKTRPNALFLSVVAQFNGTKATQVVSWFKYIRIISGLNDRSYKGFTIKCFENKKLRSSIIKLFQQLDLGITNISSEKRKEADYLKFINLDALQPKVREQFLRSLEADQVTIQTSHKKYDKLGKPVAEEIFNLKGDESSGTEKLFYLTAPLLDVLASGRILFIDEIEASLHPLITKKIIELFNSPEQNTKRAQLIFTTHDTNLLSKKQFRRDQIWFVEKDQKGASDLYSLAELKIRNDASFDKDYIQGRYGAIPFLGDFRQVIKDL